MSASHTSAVVPPSVDEPKVSTELIVFYNILFLISIPFLALMLGTAAFCKDVKRSATWYSFVSAWGVFAITSVLLIGKQDGTVQTPGFALCLSQAAILCATRMMAIVSTFCMSVQLYQVINARIFGSQYRKFWIPFLVIFPYPIAIAVTIGGLLHGIQYPELVEPQNTQMYCHFSDGLIIDIASGLTLAAMVSMYGVWIRTLIILYRYSSSLQKLDEVRRDGKVLPIVKRFTLLIVASLVPLSLSLVSAVYSGGYKGYYFPLSSNLLSAGTSIFLVILFSSSQDNWRQWRTWLGFGFQPKNKAVY